MSEEKLVAAVTFIMYLPYRIIFGSVNRDLLGSVGRIADTSLQSTAEQTQGQSSGLFFQMMSAIAWEWVFPLVPAFLTAVAVVSFLRKHVWNVPSTP